MKKSILMLAALAALTIACNKNSKTTNGKKTSADSTAVAVNDIQTEVYEGVKKQENEEDLQEKLVLYREKGSKNGKFDFTAIGVKSKKEVLKYSGTFTEEEGIKDSGRKVADVVYRLNTPTAELASYYTIKDGKLVDVSNLMIAPDGN